MIVEQGGFFWGKDPFRSSHELLILLWLMLSQVWPGVSIIFIPSTLDPLPLRLMAETEKWR